MGMIRVLQLVLLMGVGALAQSPTYGVGRTPSAEEIRAWDISIGPTGEELPPSDLVDLAPTLLRTGGMRIPDGLDGKPLDVFA